MKRQLSDEEKKFCMKRSIDLEKEIEWIRYQIEYANLILTKGLRLNFIKQEKEYKVQLREFESQLEQSEINLKELKRQIREGIEVKETKSEKEVK